MTTKHEDQMRPSTPTAQSILLERHSFYKSWMLVSDELGYNKGVLCAVANGARQPSKNLIARMNELYGCHLHLKTVRIEAPVCPVCDQPYEPRHKCAVAPTKYAPHPVKRVTAIRSLLQNQYYKDS